MHQAIDPERQKSQLNKKTSLDMYFPSDKATTEAMLVLPCMAGARGRVVQMCTPLAHTNTEILSLHYFLRGNESFGDRMVIVNLHCYKGLKIIWLEKTYVLDMDLPVLKIMVLPTPALPNSGPLIYHCGVSCNMPSEKAYDITAKEELP